MIGGGSRRARGVVRPVALLLAIGTLVLLLGRAPAATLHAQDAPQPPIADPQALVTAYYQTFTAAAQSGDYSGVLAYFTPDASIDSGLAPGSISGATQIAAFFNSLPTMQQFSVETSNLLEDDPYVDVDWRFRAAPGSLRGYLDGHDTFTIADGLITALTQAVDPQAAADALMPPPQGPPAAGAAKATTKVKIQDYAFAPKVIRVPVGATVTWTNNDADDHAVTTDDKTIDSGVIEEDVSATLTFPVAGTYPYYCTVHPGMRGEVIVGAE